MEYLKVWTSFRELLEPLTDAERGRLFVSMLEYAETGAVPCLTGNERYVWPAAKQNIDRARAESDKQTANGMKGGRPRKPTETQENPEKPTETQENPEKAYKDKDNIIYLEDEEEDEDDNNARARIADEWRQSFGSRITPALLNKLAGIAQGMSIDVIITAIHESAIKAPDRPSNYVLTVLADWQHERITTADEATEYILIKNGLSGKVPGMSYEDAQTALEAFRRRSA